MRLSGMWATFALAALVACAPAADMRDQFRVADLRLPFDQRLRFEASAPIIVLGHVLEVKEIGQPQPSTADPRIKVQLARLKVDVEEVLKGVVRLQPLDVYYFLYSPAASEIDLGVPRYLPSVGQRRIYFLKPSRGAYRSVGDVTDYTLRVSSGTHPRGFCRGKRPGCCIAEILLVPQHDVDAGSFVADLIKSEYTSEVLCSRDAAQQLAEKLTQNPDQKISDAAREVVAGTQLSR